MARTGSGSQYLEIALPVITSYPVTLACWANLTNVTAEHALLGVYDPAAQFTRGGVFLIAGGATAGDPCRAVAGASGASSNAVTSTGYTANNWHHFAAVFTSATDRAAFLDGGGKGTNATSRVLPTLSRTTIGALRNATGDQYLFSGSIAFPAIWNATLSDDDIASLAAGAHPLLIRPGSLVACWNLNQGGSPEPDILGNYPLTLNSTPTQSEDSRISLPSGVI